MFCTKLLTVLAAATMVLGTLDPAITHMKNSCPLKPQCPAAKVSPQVQRAECSHNTRTQSRQTFAVFVTDHTLDSSQGGPYGTCSAFTCPPPAEKDMKQNSDCWTFFWSSPASPAGLISPGEGAGCIKSPNDGSCGCENSNGKFVYKGSNCK